MTALVITAFCFPAQADALDIKGIDDHGNGGRIVSDASGIAIEALQVDIDESDATDILWIDVADGDTLVAKNLAYTPDPTQDVNVMKLKQLDEDSLATGSYTVTVWEARGNHDPAEGSPLYTFKVSGVFADLYDGDDLVKSILIGAQTYEGDSPADFDAPAEISDDGAAYTKGEKADNGHFVYKKQQSGAIEGSIRYLDDAGKVLNVEAVGSIGAGETLDVTIPATYKHGGTLYRTVLLGFQNPVQLRNPGYTQVDVRCIPAPEGWQYTGTVEMVADGQVIAKDSFDVIGAFNYTTPLYIYKTNADGSVTTYKRAGEDPVVPFGETEGAGQEGSVVKQMAYEVVPADAPATDVTINYIDATSGKGTLMNVQTATVDEANPSVSAPKSYTANGTVYHLAGDAADYTYVYRSDAMPVINAYYLAEGQNADGEYEVTVNYVDYLTGDAIGSSSFTSYSSDRGPVAIPSPELFTDAEGVTFARLDGQANMEHSYYSNTRAYSVYYYDQSKDLPTGVVEHVRTVYDPVVVTRTVTTSTTPAAPAGSTASSSTASSAAGANTGQNAGAVASEDNATPLNSTGTYTSVNGERSDGTLKNEQGVDTSTERILSESASTSSKAETDESQSQGSPVPMIAGLAAALAACGGLAYLLARRRNQD